MDLLIRGKSAGRGLIEAALVTTDAARRQVLSFLALGLLLVKKQPQRVFSNRVCLKASMLAAGSPAYVNPGACVFADAMLESRLASGSAGCCSQIATFLFEVTKHP